MKLYKKIRSPYTFEFQEQEELFENQDQRLEQQKLWEDVKQLMEVKIQCMQEAKAKGLGGTFSIAKNSETFTLH